MSIVDSTGAAPVVRVRVARSDALAGTGPHAVAANGVDVVIVRSPQGLRAFQGRCPHQGALLGEGEIDGGALVCRNHRWRFDVHDGRRQDGPGCLACYPVTEQDGEVFVHVPQRAQAPDGVTAATRTIHDLSGPRGWPVVGNLFQLDLARLHEVLEGWAKEYGPLYRYRLGSQWVVVISDSTLAEQVLRARPETYRRLGNIEPVFREIGVAGVFSAEGAAWRSQRRLTMEALSPRHLRGFYPRLRSVATRLLSRWEHESLDGHPIDIVDDLKRFTVDITTLLTFGHDVNTLQQGDDVIQRRLEHVFPAFTRRLFALFPTWRIVRTPSDRGSIARSPRFASGSRIWFTPPVSGSPPIPRAPHTLQIFSRP